MRLRGILSQVGFVVILLIAAAVPSAAWAHESHAHAAEPPAIAKGAIYNDRASEAAASTEDIKNAAASEMSVTIDPACNGACCGFGCCGVCSLALVEDDSQALLPVRAGTRIPIPRRFGGPGTAPEALPRPPKSFA
jgi:hypothetical protein